jgi:acyl carrier protein
MAVTVHDDLEQLFRDVFADDAITLTDETTAQDVPQWDSLGHVNLMFAIEERFGVRFRGNELAEFANVGELERFLEEHVDGSGRA